MNRRIDFFFATLDANLESGMEPLQALIETVADYQYVYDSRIEGTELQKAAQCALNHIERYEEQKKTKARSSAICEHRRRLFIESRRHTGDDGHERSHIDICPDCGTFFVFAERNGQCVQLRFTLNTPALVAAAGQYMRLLEQDEPQTA